QRGSTLEPYELLVLIRSHLEMVEQRRIEFPRPAAFDASQRLSCDVVDDVWVLTRLLRHQTKTRECGVEVRIHARGAPRFALAFGTIAPLRICLGRTHREIRENDAAEMLAEARAGLEHDETAEAMSDHERSRSELRCVAHRPHLFGEQRAGIAF